MCKGQLYNLRVVDDHTDYSRLAQTEHDAVRAFAEWYEHPKGYRLYVVRVKRRRERWDQSKRAIVNLDVRVDVG